MRDTIKVRGIISKALKSLTDDEIEKLLIFLDSDQDAYDLFNQVTDEEHRRVAERLWGMRRTSSK